MITYRLIAVIIGTALATGLCVPEVQADQGLLVPKYPSMDSSETPTGASRYRLQPNNAENMLEFSVHIWGEVLRPGLYSVPEGTSILDLISSAGGPTASAKLNSVRLLRLGMDDPDERVVEINLDEFFNDGDTQPQTLLIPEDTIIIKSKGSADLLKWTSFFSVLALAANVVVNATN